MRTYGHFYRFDDHQARYAGRSTLEIVRTPTLGVDQILCTVPDILVIMMNPGSSEPRDSHLDPEPVADAASFTRMPCSSIRSRTIPSAPSSSSWSSNP